MGALDNMYKIRQINLVDRAFKRSAKPSAKRSARTGLFARSGLIIFCTLLLTACSSTKMAYEFLDWVAMWKVDRMVELNSQQRKRTEAEIHTLHDWHRATQLPRYADYLEGLRQRLLAAMATGSVTGEQIHAETDEVQLMLDDVLEQLLPAATEIVASLSDEQVSGLLGRLAEERQEYIDEYVKPDSEERRQKNEDEFKDNLKRFIGRLNSQQEQWIDDWSRKLVPYAELSARQQILWQEHLGKYLTLRDNKALLQQGLRELMLYRTDNWAPEAEKAMDINQTLTYDLLARILNNLTDEQQKRLDKSLRGYITDFRELTKKGEQ